MLQGGIEMTVEATVLLGALLDSALGWELNISAAIEPRQ